MEINNEILNELKAISPTVAAVPRVNVFRVDAQYFDEIHNELSARISASGFYASQSFSVPAGYFESLSINVLQKINREETISFINELQQISPLLAGIGNENIYTIPTSYFEELEVITGSTTLIKNRLLQTQNDTIQTPTKVVRMSRVRSVFKYAAAAVITGLLGLSVINIVDTNSISVGKVPAATESPVMADANKIIKANNFDQELNNVSENDIVQFLQHSGQNVNAALVAASTDNDAALPNATDYLSNENTLDNFLSENNIKN